MIYQCVSQALRMFYTFSSTGETDDDSAIPMRPLHLPLDGRLRKNQDYAE